MAHAQVNAPGGISEILIDSGKPPTNPRSSPSSHISHRITCHRRPRRLIFSIIRLDPRRFFTARGSILAYRHFRHLVLILKYEQKE